MGAWFKPIEPLKLMATYQKQDQEETVFVNPETKAWVLGANYTLGAGLIRAGYGQKRPDNQFNDPGIAKTRQYSLGYDYNLSPRTYLYVDAARKKAVTAFNFVSVGIHHNF